MRIRAMGTTGPHGCSARYSRSVARMPPQVAWGGLTPILRNVREAMTTSPRPTVVDSEIAIGGVTLFQTCLRTTHQVEAPESCAASTYCELATDRVAERETR